MNTRAPAAYFDPTRDPWDPHDPIEGEVARGLVLRLPEPTAHHGSRLFLQLDDRSVLGLRATATTGRLVLERALEDVEIGDVIEVTFNGWRRTQDGARHYRHHELRILTPRRATSASDFRRTRCPSVWTEAAGAALEDPNPP